MTGEKVTTCVTSAPFTVTDPDDGDAVYPATTPTANAYVPFVSPNVIELLLELSGDPFNVIDHEVPDGSPVWVKVAAYQAAPGERIEIVPCCSLLT